MMVLEIVKFVKFVKLVKIVKKERREETMKRIKAFMKHGIVISAVVLMAACGGTEEDEDSDVGTGE